MTERRLYGAALLAALLCAALALFFSLARTDATTSHAERAKLRQVESNVQGLRSFFSTSTLPGPLTKRGAELRVLTSKAIRAMPAAQRHLLQGTQKNTGGLVRNNTLSQCHLNSTGTAQLCAVTVRRGTVPLATIQFRVGSDGKPHWASTRTR